MSVRGCPSQGGVNGVGTALISSTSRLYPILALAGATALFFGAQTVGASGFLAVYLAGLILRSHRHRATQVINQAFVAFAWLSQIVLFRLLDVSSGFQKLDWRPFEHAASPSPDFRTPRWADRSGLSKSL
jgi:hypothetical protein